MRANSHSVITNKPATRRNFNENFSKKESADRFFLLSSMVSCI
jgi:hypothetical protein